MAMGWIEVQEIETATNIKFIGGYDHAIPELSKVKTTHFVLGRKLFGIVPLPKKSKDRPVRLSSPSSDPRIELKKKGNLCPDSVDGLYKYPKKKRNAKLPR